MKKTKIIVASRVYEILGPIGETSEVERAKMNANLGQDEAEHILKHQGEIPCKFRKMGFAFPGWLAAEYPDLGYYIWYNDYDKRWQRGSGSLNCHKLSGLRLLRRKK